MAGLIVKRLRPGTRFRFATGHDSLSNNYCLIFPHTLDASGKGLCRKLF